MKRAASSARQTGLLLFDGDCGFCTSSVNWLAGNLPAAPLATPYQWADLDEYGLSTAEAAERVWYLTPTHHYGGHLAVSAMLRDQQGFGWRFIGWLLITPPISWAAALGYALVARFRHLLPGGTPACRLGPTR